MPDYTGLQGGNGRARTRDKRSAIHKQWYAHEKDECHHKTKVGPRGGIYYVNKSGKRVYLKSGTNCHALTYNAHKERTGYFPGDKINGAPSRVK